jgi:hypothetical protein|tara:strand:- start:8116 stop:8748 length:633 start_codon:yes stop_codon:yes gene_type:complete
MAKLKVLVACEYSGKVRDAFIAQGHDAMSCDFEPTDRKGKHYQGDVNDIINQGFDLLIAHPPCTYLTNASVCHLHSEDQSFLPYKGQPRWVALDEAGKFFRMLLECNIPMKAIENPIPHKYAVERIGRKYDQIVQPWMFGHTESKATCLWLEGLPPIHETNNVKEDMMKLPKEVRQRLHYLSPSKDRWKLRSETYQGIADAMAQQWGDIT